MSAADEHRNIAGGFTERVVRVIDWEAPAPVEGWVARDVVRHLVSWLPGFLASSSDVRLPVGPSADENPVAAWQSQCAAVQALLDDRTTAAEVVKNPHIGEMPLELAISRIYTADVFLHTWDLARSTGQDERLDQERCAQMYEGMLPLDEMLRSSGQYGPRVQVPDDADPQTQLLGFIGRDPGWTAPAR